jgi:predicted transposase YdaD
MPRGEMQSFLKKGMEKRTLEIAKNLRAKGIDINTIAETTGLSIDNILHL